MHTLCHVNSSFLHSAIGPRGRDRRGIGSNWKECGNERALRSSSTALRFARILPIPSLKYRFSLLAPCAATQLTYARGVRGANNVPSLQDGGSKLDPGYLHLSCARERSPRIDAFFRGGKSARRARRIIYRDPHPANDIYIYMYLYRFYKKGRGLFRGRIRGRTRRKYPLKRKFPRRWKL